VSEYFLQSNRIPDLNTLKNETFEKSCINVDVIVEVFVHVVRCIHIECIWECHHSSAQSAMMLRSKKTSNVKRVVKKHGWVISVFSTVQTDRGGHCVSAPMEGTLSSAEVGNSSESRCPPFNWTQSVLDLRYV